MEGDFDHIMEQLDHWENHLQAAAAIDDGDYFIKALSEINRIHTLIENQGTNIVSFAEYKRNRK